MVLEVARSVRPRAGTAKPQLHGHSDDDRSLVFRGHRARDRRCLDGHSLAQQPDVLVEIALSWFFLKWFVANLASNGQPLGLTFSGSFLGYLGWSILTGISFITIIGWAWVYVAWMRWFCRNLQGTRHEVVFIGSGLEFLWRALVTGIACIFIIPIPWMYRWMGQWLASQTILAGRDAQANV